jgi:hypothetical protein
MRPDHVHKLKALFLSDDGGKTWICMRQYYLTDVQENRFLDDLLQGKRFAILNNGDSNDPEPSRCK